MPERFPSFVLEFVVIILHDGKQEAGLISSKVVVFLTDTSFEMNNCKRYIVIPTNCEDITAGNTRDVILDSGIPNLLMRFVNARDNDCRALQVNEVARVLRKEINFC